MKLNQSSLAMRLKNIELSDLVDMQASWNSREKLTMEDELKHQMVIRQIEKIQKEGKHTTTNEGDKNAHK